MTTRTITVEALADLRRHHDETCPLTRCVFDLDYATALPAEPADDEIAHLRRPGGFVPEDMGTGWSQGPSAWRNLPAEPAGATGLREAVTAYLRWHAETGMGDPVTPTWQRMKAALAATTPVGEEEG